MDNIETTAANTDAGNVAAPEGVAAPLNEGNVDAASAAETEPKTAPADKAGEDVTTTQAFSRRLNEKLGAAEKALWDKVNPVIAELGGKKPDGTPIATFEDLQAALEHQKAQAEARKLNVSDEVFERLTKAEQELSKTQSTLSRYQRTEAMMKEAETISADPKWGEFFKANEDKIRAVAEKAKCDLGTAKLLVYDEQGPAKVDEQAIGDKAIQDFLDKKRELNKPTEGSGAAPVTVSQTPKTFEDARKASLAYLRSLRE